LAELAIGTIRSFDNQLFFREGNFLSPGDPGVFLPQMNPFSLIDHHADQRYKNNEWIHL
jgi:hypothetical protein